MAEVLMIVEFLDRAARTPWMYGGGPGGFRGHDCSLLLANWDLFLTGNDPAAELRETYSTREEAEAIVNRSGGMVPFIGRHLVMTGWKSVAEPQDGDAAVISVPLGRGQHFNGPALAYDGKWIVADPKRLLFLPMKAAHPLMIWRVA